MLPTTNPDAALGLFDAPWPILCLVAIVLIVTAYVRRSLLTHPQWATPVFVAGAASNLFDAPWAP